MTKPNIIKTSANGQFGIDLRFGRGDLAKDTRDLTAEFLDQFFTILERDLMDQIGNALDAFNRSRGH